MICGRCGEFQPTCAIVLAVLLATVPVRFAGADDHAAYSSIVEAHPTQGMRLLSIGSDGFQSSGSDRRQVWPADHTGNHFLLAVAQADDAEEEADDEETEDEEDAGPPPSPFSSSQASSLEVGGPFISTRSFFANNDLLFIEGIAEFPVLGRMNVGEHNSPLPRDRAFSVYKHYDNALKTNVNDYNYYPLEQRDRAIDQYLFGFEKTFRDGCSSIELRMPLLDSGNSQFSSGFASDDASVGNLVIIGKRLLHYDGINAFSAGCGVTVPTGDDTSFTLGDQAFQFRNDAVHLIPFLAMFKQSSNLRSYFMSFTTLDIPLGGNEVEFRDPALGGQSLGRLDDQMLLYLDLVLGHWLHRNPNNRALIGLAVQAELHYAGTFDDADSLSGLITGPSGNTRFNFGNSRNQFDSLIAAIMVYAELRANTDLRISGLFPMSGDDDNFFDSEVIVALQRRF